MFHFDQAPVNSFLSTRALFQFPIRHLIAWWRLQMETFSASLAICAGNSPVTGEFPTQRPVRRSFDVYFDLRPNERLSKQSWGWWFETLSSPLWRHRNGKISCREIGRPYFEFSYRFEIWQAPWQLCARSILNRNLAAPSLCVILQ